MPVQILSEADMIKKLTARDGRVHLVGVFHRVGISAYAAAIEWYWYPPSSPAHNHFDVWFMEWEGQVWAITSFPRVRLEKARKLARQLGLQIQDGAPAIMHGDDIKVVISTRPSKFRKLPTDIKPSFFPGSILAGRYDNPMVFTIENHRDSPVYKNSVRDTETMQEASMEIMEALNRGVKLSPFQIADYIYGSGSFPAEQSHGTER